MMVVPRIDPRIYGLFLFTLLLLVVALQEILPDKKYLYLALIPVCFYQLISICDYAELTLPTWLKWPSSTKQDHSDGRDPSLGTSEEKAAENLEPVVMSSNETEAISPDESKSSEKQTFEETQDQKNINADCKANSTKSVAFEKANPFSFELQNSDPCQSTQKSSNSLEPSSTTECVTIEKRSSIKSRENAKRAFETNNKEKCKPSRSVTFYEKPTFSNTHQSEFTKSYYFPHRLKRLQSCLEATTDNPRQYRMRNWSGKDYNYQMNLPTPSTSSEGSEEAFDCSEKRNEMNQDGEQDKNDLTKSYSFPLRQRRQDRWTDSNDRLDDEFNIPAMPLWDYRTSSNSREKRRKSVSTDAIDRDLRLTELPLQQKENDFFQSLELPREDTSGNDGKNISRPMSNFNKLKQGIVNRFNRSKKADSCKQTPQNRKTFLKELFSSKENVNTGSAKKIFKGDGFISTKLTRREKSSSNISPTYISYGNFNSVIKVIDDDLAIKS